MQSGGRRGAGEWRPEQAFRGAAGFHLNELCAPWSRLEDMARAFLTSSTRGPSSV